MADSCPNCNSPDGLKIVRNIVVNGIAKTLWTAGATPAQVHHTMNKYNYGLLLGSVFVVSCYEFASKVERRQEAKVTDHSILC